MQCHPSIRSNMSKRSTAILLVLFASSINVELAGQETERQDFEIGVFEEFSDVLGQLLAFDFNGKKICVRRDWEQRRKQRQFQREHRPASLRDHFELAFLRKGCNETDAIRRTDEHFRRLKKEDIQILKEEEELLQGVLENLTVRPSIRDTEPEDTLGHIIRVIGHRTRSNGYTGSGAHHMLRFSGGRCYGQIQIRDDQLLMEFRESWGLQRKLSVREFSDGNFYFAFMHDGMLVELRQFEEGPVRLTTLKNESIEVIRAESYYELLAKNKSQLDVLFYPLLQQLGIPAPITDSDDQAVQAALQFISFLDPASRREFSQLVRQLDAKTFAQRAQASDRLQDDFQKWAYFVQHELQKQDLSTEVRQRLQSLWKSGAPNDSERFVVENQLLDSPKFLVKLLEACQSVEKQKLIVSHLEKLTELDHGLDLQAWKESIQK